MSASVSPPHYRHRNPWEAIRLLDVDGSVVSSEDLVRRVRRLVASTPALRAASPKWEAAEPTATVRVEEHAERLHNLWADLTVPVLVRYPGPLGRVKYFIKRMIQRLVGWYIDPRWQALSEFSAETARLASDVGVSLKELSIDLARLQKVVESDVVQRRSLQRRIESLETGLDVVTTEAGDRDDGIRLLEGRQHELQAGVQAREAQFSERVEGIIDGHGNWVTVDILHGEVTALLERMGAASVSGADISYPSFEERFRGESTSVREQQAWYLQHFPPASEPGAVWDVGCGRGEMLEVFQEAGYEALGIEINGDMVQACRNRGLDVVEANALVWLTEQPDDSAKAVFCAQVVEHMLTSEIEVLFQRVLQKLRPDGVFIVETINPRSFHALGNHFYADVSHIRPVHPETLRFLAEQVGFASVDMVERSRHPLSDVPDDVPGGGLHDALAGLLNTVYGNQDYAIIGRS